MPDEDPQGEDQRPHTIHERQCLDDGAFRPTTAGSDPQREPNWYEEKPKPNDYRRTRGGGQDLYGAESGERAGRQQEAERHLEYAVKAQERAGSRDDRVVAANARQGGES